MCVVLVHCSYRGVVGASGWCGGVVVYASGGVSVLEIVLGNQFEAL